MKEIKVSLGSKVIRFKVGEFDENMDLDSILRIDYSNIIAEILTFPVIVNRLGVLATEMDNLVQEKELDVTIYKSKAKIRIREELELENDKKPTVSEIEDRMRSEAKYKLKKRMLFKLIKEKEYMYKAYLSAKDKSHKLDRLSMSLTKDEFDESSIQKQMNRIHYKIQKGKIQ